jgi:acyl carrier protein
MSPASVPAIAREVMRIIVRRKHVRPERIRPRTRLQEELHFDPIDLVDVILDLEKRYHLTIPDEVPLTTVGDFVKYVARHQPMALAA